MTDIQKTESVWVRYIGDKSMHIGEHEKEIQRIDLGFYDEQVTRDWEGEEAGPRGVEKPEHEKEYERGRLERWKKTERARHEKAIEYIKTGVKTIRDPFKGPEDMGHVRVFERGVPQEVYTQLGHYLVKQQSGIFEYCDAPEKKRLPGRPKTKKEGE